MKATIRPAVKEDCTEMLELIKELAEYERAPDEVTVTLEHFAASGFGPNPVWWAYVADVTNQEEGTPVDGVAPEIEGGKASKTTRRLVGFALYYIRYSTWKGKKMYLEDILVTEQCRGRGIGTSLMNQLIQKAKEENYQGITWQVLEWNEPAKHFYRKYNPVFDGEWTNVMLNFR